MNPEILLVREGQGYRILHGLLHLVSALACASEAIAEVSGEGSANITKMREGIRIRTNAGVFPLLGAIPNPTRESAKRLSQEG